MVISRITGCGAGLVFRHHRRACPLHLILAGRFLSHLRFSPARARHFCLARRNSRTPRADGAHANRIICYDKPATTSLRRPYLRGAPYRYYNPCRDRRGRARRGAARASAEPSAWHWASLV